MNTGKIDKIFGILLHSFYKKLFILKEKKKLVEGRCTFLGDSQFLDYARQAIDQLNQISPDFLQEIVSSEMLIIYHVKARFQDFKHHIFSVGDAYMAWGHRGIIAFLVYVYYREHEPKEAELHTAAWLKNRGFPDEIVSPFEEFKA